MSHTTSPLSPFSYHSRGSSFVEFENERTRVPATPLATVVSMVEQKDHPHFFFSDSFITFSIETTQFRVHRYFFERDSSEFRQVIAEHEARPGGTLLLRLTDISAFDFENFLSVLYPRGFDQPDATTVEEWTSILKVASQWKFESIRTLATFRLGLIASPVDKVVLGRRYDIPDWLPDAYMAICKRRERLTKEEGQRLGVDEVIGIADIREQFRASPKMGTEAQFALLETAFGVARPAAYLPKALEKRPTHGQGSGETEDENKASSIPEELTFKQKEEDPPKSALHPITIDTAMTGAEGFNANQSALLSALLEGPEKQSPVMGGKPVSLRKSKKGAVAVQPGPW